MKAGATQKDTTSASESNSTPNCVVVLVRRATFPSRTSMTIATKMATDASTKHASAVRMRARKPQKRFPVVSRLGSKKMPLRGCSRNSCQCRRRGARTPSALKCRLLISMLGGGLRPPSETSPRDSLRRQSRCSNSVHHVPRGSLLQRPFVLGSSPQHPHDRLPSADPVPRPDPDLGRPGHDEVGPRAEADQPVALARPELVPGPAAAHDAP